MAAKNNASLFEVGVEVLSTSVSEETHKILAQTGRNTDEGETHGNNVEWYQHVGFASRPANPEKGKAAAQAFVVRQGGQDIAIASQDLRGADVKGALGPGETCIYATGEDGTSQPRILLKDDGSINIFTKEGNESGGAGMGIFVRADGSVDIASHSGAAVMLGTDGSIKVFNGSGGIQITESGAIKLASPAKIDISGAAITLGGAAALPVAIGPNVVTAISGLQTQIIAIQTAITAMAAALLLDPIALATSAPPAQAAAGVSLGLVVAGSAAVSAASALIPSLRTSSD
jgi:hypothetical protein